MFFFLCQTNPNPLQENEPSPTPITIQTILPMGSSKYAAAIKKMACARNDPQVKYFLTYCLHIIVNLDNHH